MDFSELVALPAAQAAPLLLGWELVYETPASRLSGIIVETEAYTVNDPANHAFRGMTARNQPMFGPAGHAYIYFTYGAHHCFNVVTGDIGVAEAVLVRALAPTAGIAVMQKNRGVSEITKLCSGPGKLCQAFSLTTAWSNHPLSQPPLYMQPKEAVRPEDIRTTPRIGIKKAADLPLRFTIYDSPHISR